MANPNEHKFPKYVTFDSAMKITETAAEAVRMSFNVGQNPRVAEIKRLTAGLITMCEELRSESVAGREASVAITEFETACMWAVKAATKGL